jgi:hypothetical protein
MRKLLAAGGAAAAALALLATPAGAQQLVDAGKEGDGSGGLAFVLFAIMVFVIGGAMFAMDRIRRRATDDDGAPTP